MSDGFYRAFEERYRGSRELIKGRLAAYLPFVEPLLETYPAAAAIDLVVAAESGWNSWRVRLQAHRRRPR